MTNEKPELGDKVLVHIANLEGIVVAKSTHLYGCDRVGVQPVGLCKDGKPQDTYWFDEMACRVWEKNFIAGDTRENKTGGPSLPGQTPTRDNPR